MLKQQGIYKGLVDIVTKVSFKSFSLSTRTEHIHNTKTIANGDIFGLYSGGNRPGSVIYAIADLVFFWIYYCFFLVLKHHMFYLMCMYLDKYQY